MEVPERQEIPRESAKEGLETGRIRSRTGNRSPPKIPSTTYIWVEMGEGGFWRRVRYAGRTVQSVKTRWRQHQRRGRRDEERYKDRMVKKIAWMKEVKSGRIKAKIVYIDVCYCVAGSEVRPPPRGASWISCEG